MNTPVRPGNTYISHGQQINADYVETVIYQHLRERVEAYALTPEMIDRLSEVYVRTPAAADAIHIIRLRSSVALVGPRGSGRRITSVAMITEVGATPHGLDLDPDDARGELPAEPGAGYIVDVDEQTARDIPDLGKLLMRYSGKLAMAGAYLVISTTPAAWSTLGLRDDLASVPIGPPASSVEIFRSHLKYLREDAVADQWAGYPDILKNLDGIGPADAVRLAGLADVALSSGVRDPVQEAVSAYQNWSEELTDWFRDNKKGYSRALLIATAALDEADAASVFHAANKLGEAVSLPPEPGGGLVGDGITVLLHDIGAKFTSDGRIRLPRPAYATSVLDHVWLDRPHLHRDLRRWLVDLPGALNAPATAYAGYSLIDLAIRQGDATLITDAVSTWAGQPKCRELAATALTEAGVSGSIGRLVRRTMYTWATSATTDESLRLTVADVCGGPFGKNFPRNAMTRLRHLAIHGGPKVRDRVTDALKALAAEPGLRDSTLRDVVGWITDAGQARAPGIGAFLALSTQSAEQFMPLSRADSSRMELLSAGLRAALRDPDHVQQAREACRGWLEAAAQGAVPGPFVTDIIARTCEDSHDIGLLTPAIWRWAQADTEPTPVPRRELCAELLQKLADRDPLAPGVSAETVYQATSEDVR